MLHKRASFVRWGVPVQNHGQWTSTERGGGDKNKNKKTAFRHGPAPQQQPTKSAANTTGAHPRRKRQQQRSQQERRCKQHRLREAAPAGASSSRGKQHCGGHTAFGPRCAHVFAALPISCTTRARATALGKGAGDAAGLRSRRPPRVRPAVAPLRAAAGAHALLCGPAFADMLLHAMGSVAPPPANPPAASPPQAANPPQAARTGGGAGGQVGGAGGQCLTEGTVLTGGMGRGARAGRLCLRW